MKPTNPLEGREILIEMTQQGQYVKVTAFDTKSLTEVSIQGPRSAGEAMLQRNAIKRLEYVLRKNGIID